MNDDYTKSREFLLDTLSVLLDQIADLDWWSVHNDDVLNEEIGLLKETTRVISRKARKYDR